MLRIADAVEENEPQIPKAILDYASPTKHTPMRLASTSVITVMPAGTGFDVVERLQGQASALFAIVFSGFAVFTIAALSVPSISSISRKPAAPMFRPAY